MKIGLTLILSCLLAAPAWQLGSGRNATVSADIVLNGAIAAEGDDTNSYGYVQNIDSRFPCRSVLIQGGYHSTTPEVKPGPGLPQGSNGSLVLIGSVEGAVIQTNGCGNGEEASARANNPLCSALPHLFTAFR